MKFWICTFALLVTGTLFARQEAPAAPSPANLPSIDVDSIKVFAPLVPEIASLQAQQESLAAQQKALNAKIQDITKKWVVAQTHAIDLANQKCNGCIDPRYVSVDVKTGNHFVEQAVGPLRPTP